MMISENAQFHADEKLWKRSQIILTYLLKILFDKYILYTIYYANYSAI